MKRVLTALTVLALVLGATTAAVAQPGYPGVVTIDSVQGRPSETVSVQVWLRGNNVDVSAMTLPLTFSSSSLTLDSVSLQNAVWGSEFDGAYTIDNSAQTVRILILPSDFVSPLPSVSFVDGVVAELHFTVAPGGSPHNASIDSIYSETDVGGGIFHYEYISLSDNTDTGFFLPDFVAGNIEILAPTGIEDDINTALPTDFVLAQNYPNPFNPTTIIDYSLPRSGFVRLEVFNILGQQVATLDEGFRGAGTHGVEFDGANFPSGIYFYRLQHSGGSTTRKMMLVK